MRLWNRALNAIKRRAVGMILALPQYGWWTSVRESFTGAWQQGVTTDPQTSILAFSAVYACVTGIASDVAKLRVKLCRNVNGIWQEITSNNPFLPVLRKPNHYQNRIEFVSAWIISKLLFGNAYVLKARDGRGVVSRLYILDPQRVTPLVSDSGDVYYELKPDNLALYQGATIKDAVIVPASEIIHDKMTTLWHPLCGVPPLYACVNSATMGNKIQANSTKFFANLSRPGGVLSAPGAISNETATRLKEAWEANYGGENIGKIAVLGDGLKFEAMTVAAQASQTIEQLGFTVQDVARAFHYPLKKLQVPLNGNEARSSEQINIDYYTDCLQSLVESFELCMDEGLELPSEQGTELDIDNLWRMDLGALYESLTKASGFMKVDEQRFRANLEPLPMGGNTVYKQHQDYSIEALAKRDAGPDPFGNAAGKPAQPEPKQKEEPIEPPARSAELTVQERTAIYLTELRRLAA